MSSTVAHISVSRDRKLTGIPANRERSIRILKPCARSEAGTYIGTYLLTLVCTRGRASDVFDSVVPQAPSRNNPDNPVR